MEWENDLHALKSKLIGTRMLISYRGASDRINAAPNGTGGIFRFVSIASGTGTTGRRSVKR